MRGAPTRHSLPYEPVRDILDRLVGSEAVIPSDRLIERDNGAMSLLQCLFYSVSSSVRSKLATCFEEIPRGHTLPKWETLQDGTHVDRVQLCLKRGRGLSTSFSFY